MDDNNIRELGMEQQDTDGIAKRATEYHKRLIHPAAQTFALQRAP